MRDSGGCGDSFENFADLMTLASVSRFVRTWHAGVWHVEDLEVLFPGVRVVRKPDEEADIFGVIVAVGYGHDRRWLIQVNDRLAGAILNSTLGHEFGHVFQRPQELALCSPRTGLAPSEQEAHALGAILTVPLAALAESVPEPLSVARVAREYQVPSSYVWMRSALAVMLGEVAGNQHTASATLNWAMLSHQRWMTRIAQLLRETGAPHPL